MRIEIKAIRPTPRERLTVVAIVVFITALLAFVVLHWLGLGALPLVVFDYQMFDRLAVNVLDHHAFSQEIHSPFEASYFRAPGYPWFIAFVYMCFGRSVFALRAAQFVVLGGSAYLIYENARRFFSHGVGVTAAVLCATYPPLVFMSAMYTTETLSTFLVALAALLLIDLRAQSRMQIVRSALVGVTVALLALVRPGFTPLIGVIVAGIFWAHDDIPLRRRHLFAAVCIASYVAVIAPWLVRNRLATGHVVATSAGSGWSMYVSAQQWAGDVSFGLVRDDWRIILSDFNLRYDKANAALLSNGIPSRTSVTAQREWLMDQTYGVDARRKFASIPASAYAKRSLPRLYWLWSTSDVSGGTAHRVFQVWHIVLSGTMIAGVLAARRVLRWQFPIWSSAAYLTLLHLAYHVEARFTVPARPLLFIYSAAVMVLLARTAVARQRSHRF